MINCMKFSSIFILTVIQLSVLTQTIMRPVDELINRTDLGRPVLSNR